MPDDQRDSSSPLSLEVVQPGVPATIGILDSGVGGLPVLREIRALLPQHPLVYVGDSAWCPYGNKPAEDIRGRVRAHTDFLLKQGASLVVIACNSATIAAVEHLRATYPVPFVGMEPAVKPAAALTESGVVGVLATEASLAGEKFHRLINTHARDLRVITVPCPKFVTLVEDGHFSGDEVESAIHEYTDPLLAAGADVLVLGCTHYPFLKNAISRVVGPSVTLLDTGPAVARRVASLLPQEAGDQSSPPPKVFTTGDLSRIENLLPRLLPELPCRMESLP